MPERPKKGIVHVISISEARITIVNVHPTRPSNDDDPSRSNASGQTDEPRVDRRSLLLLKLALLRLKDGDGAVLTTGGSLR